MATEKYIPSEKILENYAKVLINFGLNCGKGVKQGEIVFLQVPECAKPILIHCQWGANRTGEAAAIWKIYKQGESKEKALDQLSIKYGHIKSKNSAKDFFISIWQGRKWLEKQYDPKKVKLALKAMLKMHYGTSVGDKIANAVVGGGGVINGNLLKQELLKASFDAYKAEKEFDGVIIMDIGIASILLGFGII